MSTEEYALPLPGSTRRAILIALQKAGQATVSELAACAGVKAMTVRHHLNCLQAAGLVEVSERRQAVGRPAHVYRLSAGAGWALASALPAEE